MGTRQGSETLPANAQSLPDSWIERLFQKFEDFYGAKWAAQYGAFPRSRVMATWAEELAGFALMPEAIARAIKAQLADPRGFPPTLPEFLYQCRVSAKSLPRTTVLQLDAKVTPEEIARNKDRLAKIAASLGRKMTA